MKNRIVTLLLTCFATGSALAQSEEITTSVSAADTTQSEYIVELVNNSIITGKKVSDDGREVGIMTTDKGLILIPKYQIRKMSVAS